MTWKIQDDTQFILTELKLIQKDNNDIRLIGILCHFQQYFRHMTDKNIQKLSNIALYMEQLVSDLSTGFIFP